MIFDIKFEKIPVGIAAESVRNKTKIKIITREFISSTAGDLFFSRLDQFPSEILSKVSKEKNIKESNVDHMVVVINKNLKAKVYINEINFLSEVQVKRPVKKGEEVRKNDISEITNFYPREEIPIEPENGILILFSVGWRKGLYFDFTPLHPKSSETIDYDVWGAIGRYYSYILFGERFSISKEQWKYFFTNKMYPFISLKTETINMMLNYARENWPIEELIKKIGVEVGELLPLFIDSWQKNPGIKKDSVLLERASERFFKKDYISCISILYPRIEGIIRSYFINDFKKKRITQKDFANSLVKDYKFKESYSLILPEKFKAFMIEVFFASFDPTIKADLSKNSLAHGVIDENEFSQLGASMGFLILDQISKIIRINEKNKNMRK